MWSRNHDPLSPRLEDSNATITLRSDAPLSLVARQPIFDTALDVIAYELLYRTPGAISAHVVDQTRATAQVILGATLDIGFKQLVGEHPAYINFPADLLMSPFQLPLHPARIVIEVLEGAVPEDRLLQSLRRLRSAGYRIALDDFDVRTESAMLLEHADIVKVDVREHSAAELAASVGMLRRYPLQLVAEKVETREELSLCRQLGFDYFQGYFLQKPEIVAARRAPGARLTVLELIARLSDPRISAAEIEACICRDVGFSYRILRCINCGYFYTPRAISSIREAILLLGFGELQKLCWLVILAGIGDQPAYVCVQALTRACMCEFLSVEAGLDGNDSYFMTGMLSMLDVILGMPLREALHMLSLNPAVNDALLHHDGNLGAALHCVQSYERGIWQDLGFMDLSATQISATYLNAVSWADNAWTGFRHYD
jgi:EAL and modified HD-GYP domain-containing signal transduction protein